LPIILYPDPRLTEKAEPRPVDDGLRAIGAAVLAAAKAAPAYGLAGVHIGEISPVVVISTATEPGRHEHMLLYNPEVLAVAEKTVIGPEGSVSMPGVQVEIMRPVWAEIIFDDETGARQTRRFEGLPARIALHEIEQMNGHFFLDRLSRLKRDMVLKKWKKRAG
jgi:peptide deformylase